ncbi:MAG: ribosome biogenesis GTPase Der [Pedosphaera sp.]|nr:ribosome biogenesis GTPase Der [Pedosphaera sp.]MST00489.1 ribosome biogenesis GTPase Der [Pedosphaera sp.]
MSGLIAIVGRPNVGKSALFNRIAGRRIAIVHDQPGVTRDRVSAEIEWLGRPFTLVDTGGIGLLRGEKAEDVITKAAFDQVQLAIESANVIILVVNVQEGIVPLDQEVAKRLRAAGKPVLVAVNKVDNARIEANMTEFARLGFDQLLPVTAIHGIGIDALMETAMKFLPAMPTAEQTPEEEPAAEGDESASSFPKSKPHGPLKIAIVGRPNVGKSSIINALTQSERVIVSPIPGTTRDAVDVPFEVETDGVRQSYVLIDTAGLRKSRRVDDSVEFFSAQRSAESIARCDIALLVLDAVSGILEQDKKIADIIVENRKACIVVVNKWDLVAEKVRAARIEEVEHRQKKDRHRDERRKQLTTLGEFGQWVQDRLFFLDYAPVIFTSAKEGFHLDRLLEGVRYVAAQLQQKIPTGLLNRTINDAIERRQPISASGDRLKFFYATQVRQSPPTFLLFVSRDELFSDSYKKHLAGELRTAFGYEGCPLVLVPKARPKTVEPIRKYKQRRSFDKNKNRRAFEKSDKPRPQQGRAKSKPNAPRDGGGKPGTSSVPRGNSSKPGPQQGRAPAKPQRPDSGSGPRQERRR